MIYNYELHPIEAEYETWEEFDHLPQRISSRMARRLEHNDWKMYYRDYSRLVNNLNKIKLEKFVGEHINVVTSRYTARFRTCVVRRWRRRGGLLAVLNVEDACLDSNGSILIFDYNEWIPITKYLNRWHSQVYYVHPETGILTVERLTNPPETRKQKRLRARKEKEKLKALTKIDRENKHKKEAELSLLLSTVFKNHNEQQIWNERRRKEKQQAEEELTRQKMISKGFDPLLSFRKSINDG